MTFLHFVIYIIRLVVKVNIRLLFKTIGWQTMNLVAGYDKVDGNVHCAKCRVGQSLVTWTCMFGIETIIKTT